MNWRDAERSARRRYRSTLRWVVALCDREPRRPRGSTAGSSRLSRCATDRTRAPALGDCGSRDLPPVIGAAGALGERRSRWIDHESVVRTRVAAALVAVTSYPEFRITAFILTFRLSRLGGSTALFFLLLWGLGWSAGRDNREGVEEREERVGGLVAAGWGADRGGPVDRFLFEVC